MGKRMNGNEWRMKMEDEKYLKGRKRKLTEKTLKELWGLYKRSKLHSRRRLRAD
jgi:hypothetical protein